MNEARLDETYQRMLKGRGYRVTTLHEWQALFVPRFKVLR
jgi:hypothetical protein